MSQYRIRNWSEYNAALKQRGSLTFWIDEAALANWENKEKTGKRGSSPTYTDIAIATMATLKGLFKFGGRQTEGFLNSLFELMAEDLSAPDHSTLSRRLGRLKVELPTPKRSENCHLVVDSTGVKVYGEGEWKVRQHGWSKRRTWRKLHLGVDEQSGEILAAMVSTNNVSDSEALPELLDAIDEDIELEQVSTDGAYDTRDCYDAIVEHGAQPVIPPRRNSKIWQHGNCKAPPHPRDQALRQIRQQGRKHWKKESGYHRRSIAETTMFRFKAIFGGMLQSRKFDNQAVELLLKCAALNRMIQLAKPDSYLVEA